LSAVWTPVAPDALPDVVAEWLVARPGIVRVAVDGPPCADPGGLADSVVGVLPASGRPAVHLSAGSFWRDASIRLQHGREDVESYLSWLDADALRREVLAPLTADGSYLPSLRDPSTNRSTREPRRQVDQSTVVLVSGPLLLGLGLPFDRTIHLAMSTAARARHTIASEAWTLPAYERYDASVRPAEVADVVIKLDDPRHPAVRGLDAWRDQASESS
jgi:hypothetical protein